MSAKDVGLVIVIMFIAIAGFIILAPEYKKNAELKAMEIQKQEELNKMNADINHTRAIIAKLEAKHSPTIVRVLREFHDICKEGDYIIHFKTDDSAGQTH